MIGYINKIETLGLVDGPGVRVVVFLQGCPLRCVFCHNPETWQEKKGEMMTPLELVKKILRYQNYFKDGGGVTFSGGEPLLQSEFLLEVLKLCKKEQINTCLDTSGIGEHYEELLPYIDLILLDVKALTNESYLKITGKHMDHFLSFLEKSKEVPIWIRQVIVPGINDREEYILKLKEFLKPYSNIEKIELLPYHTMAISKYEDLKIPYRLKNIPAADKKRCQKLEELLK